MQFTDLCAQLLRELHEVEGKSEEDIRSAMRTLPFVSLESLVWLEREDGKCD